MMLPAQGPTTTLTEDFSVLGILKEGQQAKPEEKAKQVKQDDEKGGDYAGPPADKDPKDPGGDVDLDGDEAAGHYTYVPVRGDENVGPDGKYGKARGGAKNESVEEVRGGKMVPAFLIPPTPSADEIAEAEEALAEEAAAAQLDRAWDVINSYFSEDEDGLNEEGLRGVINAMGFALNVAVEDIANLSTENARLTESVNDLNRLLKEAEESDADDKADDKDEGDEDEGDEDEDEGKAEEKPALVVKALLSKKKEESRRGGNLTEDASLNSILDEVASIGGSPRKQAVTAQAKLVEAFEAVVESASDVCGRVVAVIRNDEGLSEDEDINLPETDQRLRVAQYFYGIAEDAQNYLDRLVEGNVAFRVAEEDLNRLRADFEQGIDALHKIPA